MAAVLLLCTVGDQAFARGSGSGKANNCRTTCATLNMDQGKCLGSCTARYESCLQTGNFPQGRMRHGIIIDQTRLRRQWALPALTCASIDQPVIHTIVIRLWDCWPVRTKPAGLATWLDPVQTLPTQSRYAALWRPVGSRNQTRRLRL